MSTEGLKIVIGADVLQGIVGIEKFNEVLSKSEKKMKAVKPASDSAGLALINLGRVAQDAPFGFIAISNNINPLLESFQRLKAETGSTGGALKALVSSLAGGAGIGLAVSLATSLLTLFAQGLFKTKEEAKDAADETKKFADAAHSSGVSLQKQLINVEALVAIARSDVSTKTQQSQALESLNKLIPENIGHLNKQNIATGEGLTIIRKYTQALEDQATAELLSGKAAEIRVKKFEDYKKATETVLALQKEQVDVQDKLDTLRNAPQISVGTSAVGSTEVAASRLQGRLNDIRDSIKDVLAGFGTARVKANKDLSDIRGEIVESVKGGLPVSTTETTESTKKLVDIVRKARLAIPDLAPDPELIVGWDELGFAIRRFGDTSFKVFDRIVPMQTQATVLNVDAAQKHALALAATITDIVNPAFDAFFSSIATGSGNMLKAFANAIKQIIVQMIAAIAKAIIFAAILSFLPGGGTFKMPNIGKVLGFGGAHAAGGITTGPQLGLIGEAGPEAIIPLRDINKVMGMIGGGRQQVFISDTVVRGSDLVITYKRETGRLGGTFS